jgi:hypothetical protein
MLCCVGFDQLQPPAILTCSHLLLSPPPPPYPIPIWDMLPPPSCKCKTAEQFEMVTGMGMPNGGIKSNPVSSMGANIYSGKPICCSKPGSTELQVALLSPTATASSATAALAGDRHEEGGVAEGLVRWFGPTGREFHSCSCCRPALVSPRALTPRAPASSAL